MTSIEWMLRRGPVIGPYYILLQTLRMTIFLLYNVSEISMTFMNAIYGRIKTFRWKEKVWLIIEDEGVYEMVADKKVSQVD